jgi:hypothetical protein
MMDWIIYGMNLAAFFGTWYMFACVAATAVRNQLEGEI